MTRRYTGAEARELAAKASPGPWRVGACHWVRRADRTPVAKNTSPEDAALLAAAPDLAESLAAVEAERDAGVECVRALRDMLSQTERERDALRAAVRSALAAYDAVYCDDGYHLDREAALAALREAAK